MAEWKEKRPLQAGRLNGPPHKSGISRQSFALDADAGSGPGASASIWVLPFGLDQSKSRTNPCWSKYMECTTIPLFTGARTSLLESRAWAGREAIARMTATGPDFDSERTMTCTSRRAPWIELRDCRIPMGSMENL